MFVNTSVLIETQLVPSMVPSRVKDPAAVPLSLVNKNSTDREILSATAVVTDPATVADIYIQAVSAFVSVSFTAVGVSTVTNCALASLLWVTAGTTVNIKAVRLRRKSIFLIIDLNFLLHLFCRIIMQQT